MSFGEAVGQIQQRVIGGGSQKDLLMENDRNSEWCCTNDCSGRLVSKWQGIKWVENLQTGEERIQETKGYRRTMLSC
jgi:hypothetical protein